MLASAILCLVVAVADGDTLTARCGTLGQYKQVKVRLSAIDAPERRQPFGERSRQALAELCFGKEAAIRTVATDRYKRTVADVECGGKDVGTTMVQSGTAWVYDAYAAKYPKLYPLQVEAQTRRVGLWIAQDPTPPWEWRKERRAREALESQRNARHGR
ncbi:MAG: thermonuclease family protein [Alcaligenaceae bacterium]|nr:MAG: thermonuclease family protein [Alcaligenaceae bacterium]